MTNALRPGSIIAGRYELIELVGEGGMSTVWRGIARSTEFFARPVAVKVIRHGFSAKQPHLDMFLEEARIGAELQHPNLIQVFDFVADARGSHCLVLEWIEGMDLRTLVNVLAAEERPMPWSLVAHVAIGVLRGLAAAHERKLHDGTLAPVIHRDASPRNILLGVNGTIKLADFGLARARDRGALTAPGIVKGTLSYLAPEMLRGKQPSPRSDLFSLACTLWEALTAERLFDARSDIEVVEQIKGGQVRSLYERRPDLPPRLVATIQRALATDPEERFPSARDMIQELGEVLRESGPWIDSDILVGRTVAQAREAKAKPAGG